MGGGARMSETKDSAWAMLRERLSDADTLVSAVASGRQRASQPRWRRVDLRYVDLARGRHLQQTAYDATQAFTTNHPTGADAEAAIDDLLREPFGHWHLETSTRTIQVRVTKRGDATVHSRDRHAPSEPDRGHDREKSRLLAEDDPVLIALGISSADGRIKPTRRAKYRQVEEFVRLLEGTLTEAIDQGHLRTPSEADPLRIVDLGCGNAYLTFAAQRVLGLRGLPVSMSGVDTKQQARDHNAALSSRLGLQASFIVGSIAAVEITPAPEVVLALHACDTATDDALARAIEWEAPVVLAAPCCHHDIARQLRENPTPSPYAMLTRSGILRERFADTLTDALRATLLRMRGYRVDVVEFVESAHTPRNSMLRAIRTGGPQAVEAEREYAELTHGWGLQPRLGALLGHGGA
jgi:Methyltransferase domain